MPTYNRDSGLDFHLRMLGIKDRENWELVSRDDQEFSNLLVKCRPDWTLHNIVSDEYRVVEYKSRPLYNGSPSRYERYQAIINATVVADDLSDQLGRDVVVTAHLIYGDGVMSKVRFSKEDGDTIMEYASEAISDMFLKGLLPNTSSQISATVLAKMLANNPSTDLARRAAGLQAHVTLIQKGPQPTRSTLH